MSKFYGFTSDVERKERLKQQEPESGLEIDGADLVVLDQIGEGGYGVVQVCYHTKHHLVFAVKQPRTLNKRDIGKLKNEYRYMRQFSRHPGVIHAFGWVDQIGNARTPGIVQEYAIYQSA